MPDYIGTVPVPDFVITSHVFPITPSFPFVISHSPVVAEHLIDNTQANRKITQRYYIGPNPRRWTFTEELSPPRLAALRDFWESRSGPYEAFLFNAPNADQTTTQYTVTFDEEPLSWRQLTARISSTGLTLVELPLNSATPAYSVESTQTRIPSGSLASALLSQIQELIPLVVITAADPGYPVVYLSDRRCVVGGQLYLPRLLGWNSIEQSTEGDADQAVFRFGNADRVMSALAASTNLWKADVQFSLYHVGSQIKLNVWRGEIISTYGSSTNEFQIECSDFLHDQRLVYPRRITRTCYKIFNQSPECPYSTQGSLNPSYPEASATYCDKGYRTPNGCEAHNMNRYHGGILAEPQIVHIKDNSTGTWGFGRNNITAASIIGESVYDQVLPLVFTDVDFPVPAKIIAGRDESDFYAALGIVCQGPVVFAENNFTASPQVTPHLLDGQPPHGATSKPPRNDYGFRQAPGTDPAGPEDYFSLGQGGAGPQTYSSIYSAGTAFIEIRRNDEKGVQYSKLEEHGMQATVSRGLQGWTWAGPGSRNAKSTLTNPVWIMVNLLLLAARKFNASAEEQERLFDVSAAVEAASICDQIVPKLVGTGNETQFRYRMLLQEEQSIRKWISDLSLACLGYHTIIFGKLKLGIRANASAVEAWTEGNILADSLELSVLRPEYNTLTAVFANEDYQYQADSQTFFDDSHVSRYGQITGQINLPGCTNRSHALRVCAIKVRESLGGVTEEEFRKAREISFRTTILGLHAEPGMVCSLTHADAPGGFMKFRVRRVRINPDYSVDISGVTVTDSMYNLLTGPKPADVDPGVVPAEPELAPSGWSFSVDTPGDGRLVLKNFNCANNSASVVRAHFSIYYHDESTGFHTRLVSNLDSSDTNLGYFGDPLVPGEYILIDQEVMLVNSVSPVSAQSGTATVVRGRLGTSAAPHQDISTTITSVSSVSSCRFTVGAGLAVRPGYWVAALAAGNGYVSSYDPATGVCHTSLPLAGVNPPHQAVFFTRIYKLSRRDDVVHFQPRFFKSPGRVQFQHQLNLPFAAVPVVEGFVENSLGMTSEIYRVFESRFPHFLRTLGSTSIVFSGKAQPGLTVNALSTAVCTSSQSVHSVYAEVPGSAPGSPIAAPQAIQSVIPGAFTSTGSITLGGTVSAGSEIQVIIGDDPGDPVRVEVPTYTVTVESTLAQVAQSLANWMNGGEEFFQWFDATASGPVISILDRHGAGGKIRCLRQGTVTATPSGMTPTLGIREGRRYAVSFRDTVNSLESELSPLSSSTGPTGSAAEVVLRGIPTSSDSRVNARRIWAVPDGADSPYYLIGTIADNTTTEFVDAVLESALTSGTPWSGGSHPIRSGPARITVKASGVPYAEMIIPANSSVSNVISGLALQPMSPGMEFTVDVDNQADQEIPIRVYLHSPKSVESLSSIQTQTGAITSGLGVVTPTRPE